MCAVTNGDGTHPSHQELLFSLILATINRTDEFANFLRHLNHQTCLNFELIVVDQNPDNRLVPLLAEYSEYFSIRHCRSVRGLSRARNEGLRYAAGEIVAFPDDDCWYYPDLLERVAAIFAADPALDGLTGRPIDKSFARFHTVSGPINRKNVFHRCSSFTIFLRRRVVEAVGSFDEGLGLGTDTGRIAAEESDYLLRALAAGFRLDFHADLEVPHSEATTMYDRVYNRKARGYNLALGYVFRKHRYSFWYVGHKCFRALGGILLSAATLNFPKARYHTNVLEGRILGYLEHK